MSPSILVKSTQYLSLETSRILTMISRPYVCFSFSTFIFTLSLYLSLETLNYYPFSSKYPISSYNKVSGSVVVKNSVFLFNTLTYSSIVLFVSSYTSYFSSSPVTSSPLLVPFLYYLFAAIISPCALIKTFYYSFKILFASFS